LGVTIAGFGGAGGDAADVSIFGVDASFVIGPDFGCLSVFTLRAAGTFEAIFGGRFRFDFGTALGFTTFGLTLSFGPSDWVGRFSCVIDAGTGGVRAFVGSNSVEKIGRPAIPCFLAERVDLEGFNVFGRFSLERGIWSGGLAKRLLSGACVGMRLSLKRRDAAGVVRRYNSGKFGGGPSSSRVV